MQRLTSRELVKLDELRKDDPEKKRLLITFLPASEPILEDLNNALKDMRQSLFAGFTEEEAETCLRLNSRIQDNIRKTLS